MHIIYSVYMFSIIMSIVFKMASEGRSRAGFLSQLSMAFSDMICQVVNPDHRTSQSTQ